MRHGAAWCRTYLEGPRMPRRSRRGGEKSIGSVEIAEPAPGMDHYLVHGERARDDIPQRPSDRPATGGAFGCEDTESEPIPAARRALEPVEQPRPLRAEPRPSHCTDLVDGADTELIGE